MRTTIAVTAVLAGMLLAGSAHAQRTLTFGGADPTRIQNKPVTIPDHVQKLAAPQLRPQPSFYLSRFLPKITLPSASPVHGVSQFPTAANMPGKEYLKAFRFQHAMPIQP